MAGTCKYLEKKNTFNFYRLTDFEQNSFYQISSIDFISTTGTWQQTEENKDASSLHILLWLVQLVSCSIFVNL